MTKSYDDQKDYDESRHYPRDYGDKSIAESKDIKVHSEFNPPNYEDIDKATYSIRATSGASYPGALPTQKSYEKSYAKSPIQKYGSSLESPETKTYKEMSIDSFDSNSKMISFRGGSHQGSLITSVDQVDSTTYDKRFERKELSPTESDKPRQEVKNQLKGESKSCCISTTSDKENPGKVKIVN